MATAAAGVAGATITLSKDRLEDWHTLEIKQAALKLINVVGATLLYEPRYYSSADDTRTRIIASVNEVVVQEPEFLLQLAFYVREELNIRSTANFLLALAALHKQCHPFLAKYFCLSVRLPTDLMEIYALVSQMNDKRIPSVMRKAMVAKFAEFDEYQLAKYNNEGKLKRKRRKEKVAARLAAEKAAANKDEDSEDDDGMRRRRKHNRRDHDSAPEDAGTEKPKLPSLKFLVRNLHISKPADLVMGILGHKYPVNEEEFKKSGLSGAFDASRAGKRMRLHIPETWETQLSALGNRAEVWLNLIDNNKLPFMAMLRNLRNLLLAGLPQRAHDWVIEQRLTNEHAVASSRQFPFRFFSAYTILEQIEKGVVQSANKSSRKCRELSVEDKAQLTPQQLDRVRRAEERAQLAEKKKKELEERRPPGEVIAAYKQALDEAVKIAIRRNVPPIRGYTVAMADISGSMHQRVSSAKGGMGSITEAYDISILMSLMCCHICEKADMYIFGTSGRHPKPYYKIDPPVGNSILANMEYCKEKAEQELTGGNEYFYGLFESWIKNNIKVDRMLVFTDVAIDGLECQGNLHFGGIEGIVKRYRERVNPDFAYITVDLFGSGRSNVSVGEGSHPGNILISGYSDQIFRFVGANAESQLQYVKSIDKNHRLFKNKE